MQSAIQKEFEDSISVLLASSRELGENVVQAVECILASLQSGRKILVCGNGGSAADAQHFAAEFVGKFRHKRVGLPAIALTTDTSALTAIGNDFSFPEIFSRQIEAIGKKGDVLVAISTSGESPNVLRAVERAKILGIRTIGMSGKNGVLKTVVDIAISVPSADTARIQESHEVIEHIIGGLIEKLFFNL